jgi:hypothetical protein
MHDQLFYTRESIEILSALDRKRYMSTAEILYHSKTNNQTFETMNLHSRHGRSLSQEVAWPHT